MTLQLSDIEMFYLQDDHSLVAGTTWQNYRLGLSWQRWNRRISFDTSNPSVPSLIGDQDGVNSADGYSLRFLRGKYAYGPMNSPYFLNNYIIDNADPLLVGSHPIWQFTIIAAQNNNSTDKCYRFGVDTGHSYTGGFTGTGDPGEFTSDATNYQGIRWIGLIDSSDFTTSYFLSNSSYFPLHFALQQSTSLGAIDNNRCVWNALAEGTLNIDSYPERIYHGYNNSKAYTVTWNYKPWQIANWIATQDSNNNYPGRREHVFDIPSNKTLIGIMAVTRDSKAIKNESSGEDNSSTISPISQYNWKISQVNVRAQRLVI